MAFYERAQISNPVSLAVMPTKTDWMLGGTYNFEVAKLYATYGQAKVRTWTARTAPTRWAWTCP